MSDDRRKSDGARQTMHLLVIEDNPDLVANLCDYLEVKGHACDVAYDGPGGLRLALENDYDAVVLDLMLPGMDGIVLCGRLREAGRAVPVLMLTARDTLQDKLEGFTSGADDYLVKPFALQELEARLAALVRRARGEQVQKRLTLGDLVLDPHTLQVQRGGTRLDLPPISFKILELLMRHAPRVVTRREIERTIWGDTPPDSDVLRAHMHMLRAVVDRPFDRPLLHTVRGIGYRIGDEDALSL